MKIDLSNRRTATRAMLILCALTVIVLAAALSIAGCDFVSRADQCKADGGTVETEIERKRVNGKWTTVTEHECIKDGVELYEW
jgi:hypothetical protein